MALPLKPPLLPQLARPAKNLPTGEGWAYEPKWDGFRAIAFVDGADVYIQSRSGKPLRRYFPELVLPGRALRARRRDRPVRRRGPPGLRRARPAHPPRRVAHQHARRADADGLHRLRPAGVEDESLLSLPRRRAPPAPGGRRRRPGPAHPDDRGPGRGRAVARGPRGRDRQAPGRRLRARQARRHVQDQARPHDRRRRRRLAPRQGRGHRRLAHPRPHRRRRRSCASSATPPA